MELPSRSAKVGGKESSEEECKECKNSKRLAMISRGIWEKFFYSPRGHIRWVTPSGSRKWAARIEIWRVT